MSNARRGVVAFSIAIHLWACHLCIFSHAYVSHRETARPRILGSARLRSEAGNGDNAAGMSDDELIRLIRGPLGNTPQKVRTKPKAVMVLSDGTGITARSAIEKTMVSQFNGCDERFFNARLSADRVGSEDDESFDDDEDNGSCEVLISRLFPFIRKIEEVEEILENAKQYNTLIVFTFADPEMRDLTQSMCEDSNIQYIDILAPMFEKMSIFFDRKPDGKFRRQSMARRELSDSYYRRVEAVEFTLKCDDGQSPNSLKDADVIILGVSRTGKTPLSVVLSQTMGLKVANIPLVVDLPPPRQLFSPDIDPKRVFCLTLNTQDLQRIRRTRLRKELKQASRSSPRSAYADLAYVQRDLDHARTLALENGYTIVDVTGRAVEETASLISSFMNERFSGSIE